jgi:4-amino-4-deoxy-L-arabinose transferase-like glycosyltransferase
MRKDNAVLIILLAMFMFVSPGGLWLILFVGLMVRKFAAIRSAEAPFLANLFLASFALRVALLLLISAAFIFKGRVLSYPDYPGWTPNLIGDAAYYTLRGYWMSLDWRGLVLSDRVLLSTYNPIYGWNGYTYLLAIFHYLFGFSPVSSTLFNCLLGSINGILVFFIAREYLSSKVSRIAAVMVSFLPSMVLWSITNLKDTALISITLIIIWAFMGLMKCKRRHVIPLLICIIAGLFIQLALRKYTGFLMLAILVLSYFLGVRGKVARIGAALIALVAVLIALFTGTAFLKNADNLVHTSIYHLLSIHQATVPMKGSSYKILDDKYYVHNPEYKDGFTPEEDYYAHPTWKLGYRQYAHIYARAMTHFLFEHYLWKSNTNLQLLSVAQMVFWYAMLPFALFGFLIMWRYSFQEYSILFIYFFLMSFFIAMTQGNVGTLFRVRDVVSPVILLWASIGLAKIMKWRIMNEEHGHAAHR